MMRRGLIAVGIGQQIRLTPELSDKQQPEGCTGIVIAKLCVKLNTPLEPNADSLAVAWANASKLLGAAFGPKRSSYLCRSWGTDFRSLASEFPEIIVGFLNALNSEPWNGSSTRTPNCAFSSSAART